MSLRRWPVRGVTNHLIYKNIYCAMCNGIDPQQDLNLTKFEWYVDEDLPNRTMHQVEWWPAKIHCPLSEIEAYRDNQPTHTKLTKLIRR